MLSWEQELAMVLLPVPISILSALASYTLCRLIIRAGLTSPYRRILFVISLLDVVSSFSFLGQPFLLPMETSSRFYALGNHSTCRTTGMLFQLAGTSTALYSLGLSLFFLCTIRFRMKASSFATRVEPTLHLVAFGFPLLTSVASFAMDTFHESQLGAGCFIDCSQEVVEAGDCNAHITAYLFLGLPVFVSFVGLAVNNLAIFLFVRKVIKKTYVSALNQEQQSEKIQQVAIQAFLYVAAFLGTYTWTSALRILEKEGYIRDDESRLFPLLLAQAILVPSTGIFNLMIYLRRKYVLTRKKHPYASRVRALQAAMMEMDNSADTLFFTRKGKLEYPSSRGVDHASISPTDRESFNDQKLSPVHRNIV